MQRDTPIRETLFAGTGTIDAVGSTTSPENDDKQDGDVDITFGGGALNAAEAYQAAGGRSIVSPITGADETGNLLVRLLQVVFVTVRRIASATQTRVSIIVSGLCGNGSTATITRRHAIDHAATFNHLQPVLKPDRRLVLASMTANDAPLIRRLLDANPGETSLLLTKSQCEEPDATLDLMRSCRFVQLNAIELETLTGVKDNGTGRPGINWLRQRGIESVIVTLGSNGVTAYIDGQFYHKPAFDVANRNGTSKCGDIGFGTFLAAIDRGEPISTALRAAMAASAMHRAAVPRTGWDAIQSFAKTAEPLPFTPTQASRSTDAMAAPERWNGRRVATLVAAVVLLITTTITIFAV